MPEQIGFIGLGRMGSLMASRLLDAGFPLRVYNRSPEKARALVDRGATLTAYVSEAVTPGGILVTMVADDRALESVANDAVAKSLGTGGLHISMSTVLPATSEKLAALHGGYGSSFVVAPVFGRPEAAGAGKLWICASGPAKAKARAKAVFDVLGQGVFDFGENVGAANVVKLAGNFLIMSAVEAMAEASALAEKNGIPRAALLDMFTKTLFACPIYQNYSRQLIDPNFEKVGFALRLVLKDMNLALQTAGASNAPMPALSLLRDRCLASMAKGRGDMDATAIVLEAAESAGLKW